MGFQTEKDRYNSPGVRAFMKSNESLPVQCSPLPQLQKCDLVAELGDIDDTDIMDVDLSQLKDPTMDLFQLLPDIDFDTASLKTPTAEGPNTGIELTRVQNVVQKRDSLRERNNKACVKYRLRQKEHFAEMVALIKKQTHELKSRENKNASLKAENNQLKSRVKRYKKLLRAKVTHTCLCRCKSRFSE